MTLGSTARGAVIAVCVCGTATLDAPALAPAPVRRGARTTGPFSDATTMRPRLNGVGSACTSFRLPRDGGYGSLLCATSPAHARNEDCKCWQWCDRTQGCVTAAAAGIARVRCPSPHFPPLCANVERRRHNAGEAGLPPEMARRIPLVIAIYTRCVSATAPHAGGALTSTGVGAGRTTVLTGIAVDTAGRTPSSLVATCVATAGSTQMLIIRTTIHRRWSRVGYHIVKPPASDGRSGKLVSRIGVDPSTGKPSVHKRETRFVRPCNTHPGQFRRQKRPLWRLIMIFTAERAANTVVSGTERRHASAHETQKRLDVVAEPLHLATTTVVMDTHLAISGAVHIPLPQAVRTTATLIQSNGERRPGVEGARLLARWLQVAVPYNTSPRYLCVRVAVHCILR